MSSNPFQPLNVERIPRLALSPAEPAESLGICERKMTDLLQDGTIPSCRIGRRRVIPVFDLRKRLSELAAAEGGGENG